MINAIYLDWNSYGRMYIHCLEVINQSWLTHYNPQSKHKLGLNTKIFMNNLQNQILHHLQAHSYRLIFTSGATEANVHIIKMFTHIFVSDTEHPSILHAPNVHVIPVDHNGALDLEYLEKKLQNISGPFLVSVILANHETGIIYNLSQVRDVVKKYGGFLHTDAVQALGRIPISLEDLDVDYMTIAPHKCGGPIGIGALLYKNDAPMARFTWGQEMRSGTVPVPLISGFAATFDIPYSSNKYLEDKISDLENVVIVGKELNRLPNTTCIYFKNIHEHGMALLGFSIKNIYVSSGAACSTSDRAHSTLAMGIEYPTVRISSGWSTTTEDFEKCYAVIKEMNEWKQ